MGGAPPYSAAKLPLPLLVKVNGERLLIRHLTRDDAPVHPSEIYWMLGEFPAPRALVLTAGGKGFAVTRGIAVPDNAVNFDVGFTIRIDSILWPIRNRHDVLDW